MSEKGVLITDQTGGESVACRDAFEQDDASNSRIVQRVDFAGGRSATPLITPARTALVADTGLDLTNLPAGILSSLMDCGDNTKMVIYPQFLDNGNQIIDLIPIAFDNEASPGALWTYTALNFACDTTLSFKRSSLNKDYLDEPQVITLNGAHKIGLYVKTMSGASGCSPSTTPCLGVSFWMFMI